MILAMASATAPLRSGALRLTLGNVLQLFLDGSFISLNVIAASVRHDSSVSSKDLIYEAQRWDFISMIRTPITDFSPITDFPPIHGSTPLVFCKVALDIF